MQKIRIFLKKALTKSARPIIIRTIYGHGVHQIAEELNFVNFYWVFLCIFGGRCFGESAAKDGEWHDLHRAGGSSVCSRK